MIPLPSEGWIIFRTVPVQKKRRIYYDDDDTDSDNNMNTATATPRRVLFQQSPPRLPRRRAKRQKRVAAPTVAPTTSASVDDDYSADGRNQSGQDGGTGNSYFEWQSHHFPAASSLPTKKKRGQHRLSTANARTSRTKKLPARPTLHRRHSTRKVTKTDRLVDQRPKPPVFLDDNDDDDNDENKGT